MDAWLQTLFSGAGLALAGALVIGWRQLRKGRLKSLNVAFKRCAALPLAMQADAVAKMKGLRTEGIGVAQDVRRNSEGQPLTIVSSLRGSTATVTCLVDAPSPSLLFLRTGNTIRFDGIIDEIDSRTARITSAHVTAGRWL